MEKTDAVSALAALAQDNRLDVFRLLVQAGPQGMPAGAVAEALQQTELSIARKEPGVLEEERPFGLRNPLLEPLHGLVHQRQ